MITSTVSQRGQTTLPKQVREKFGIGTGNKLVYEVHDDGFLVKPHPGVMTSFGALKQASPAQSTPEAARKQARKDWAEHASREG